MNFIIVLPIAFMTIPMIPLLLEIFKRKDKGPRPIPETTIHEERPKIESVPVLERARASARIKTVTSDILRIVGDVSIPDGTEIKNNIVVQGYLRLGKKCRVLASIKASRGVEVGEGSSVDGHILSDGKVIIGRNAVVRGIVDSLQNITLMENSFVEAVSTEKAVRIESGAKVNRRILSGTSIITLPPKSPPASKPPQPSREMEAKVPSEEKAELTVSKVTVPIRGVPEERPTDQIFESIKERITRLDKTEVEGLDEEALSELNALEVDVLKDIASGRDIYEIGLRLLIDPLEVRKIVDGLIRKEYLDENLRIIKGKGRDLEEEEEPQLVEEASEEPKASEVRVEEILAEWRRASERLSSLKEEAEGVLRKPVEEDETDEAGEEERGETSLSVEEQEKETSIQELFEKLLASKMRKELKEKFRTQPEAKAGSDITEDTGQTDVVKENYSPPKDENEEETHELGKVNGRSFSAKSTLGFLSSLFRRLGVGPGGESYDG